MHWSSPASWSGCQLHGSDSTCESASSYILMKCTFLYIQFNWKFKKKWCDAYSVQNYSLRNIWENIYLTDKGESLLSVTVELEKVKLRMTFQFILFVSAQQPFLIFIHSSHVLQISCLVHMVPSGIALSPFPGMSK